MAQSRRPSVSSIAPPKKQGGRRAPPANETARARFLRIGQPRMVSAVRAIRLLGNLARGDYAWDDRDVSAMQATLLDEVSKVVTQFSLARSKAKQEVAFSFDQAAGSKPRSSE